MYKEIKDPNELYEDLISRHQHSLPNQNYWWAIAYVKGKPIVVGSANSEEEIANMCMNKGADDFETYELPTRNESRATRMLKASRLKKGDTFEKALERMGHRV